MTPDQRLADALLAAVNQRIPCQGPDSDLWTSDDAADRAEAAEACQGCPLPVFDACAAVGETEQWHVFGGVDRTRKGRKAGAA